MESKNEINNNRTDNDEKPKPNENNLNRLDSPNINDNETNTILEKEENIHNNNIIELDNNVNINKEFQKKNFFHDKDITEDSIIYFSNILKQNNKSYKIYLYISIIIYIIDIIIWFINDNVVHNYFNLFSIIIIFISVIYQAYIFRHNFESISKEIYNSIHKIFYIYNTILIVFLINNFYIIFYQLFNYKIFITSNIFDFPFLIHIYIAINFYISINFSFKLYSVKRGIKNLAAAKGEIYESSKYEEVQIINSVLNEI